MSKLLTRKPESGVTKRRTRRGEATREHGLRNTIKRGVKGAMMGAFGLAKETTKLGGVRGVLADTLLRTTGTLLGMGSKLNGETSIIAGWNVDYQTLQTSACCNLSVSFTKTPECIARIGLTSRLEFKSPADDFIRILGVDKVKERRKSSCSRLTVPSDMKDSFTPEACAIGERVLTSPLPPPTPYRGHGSDYYFPRLKSEPGTPSDIDTIPLSPLEVEPLLNPPRVKTERIKQEVP